MNFGEACRFGGVELPLLLEATDKKKEKKKEEDAAVGVTAS